MNGNEIHVGDICKFLEHSYLAEVIYSDEYKDFFFESYNKETRNNPLAIMSFDSCIVIGKISENPEILKND